MDFARPNDLQSALSLLARGERQILSGGTDFYPAHSEKPVTGPVLDISALAELRGITGETDHWRIGALATWTDVIAAGLPPAFDALKEAAREVGSIQIQNRATVSGNICNASPAADGVPPLLVVDAVVETRSLKGARQIPLADFITGNRCKRLEATEMVTAILVPKAAAKGHSAFVKLGARKYLVISIAMVAARIATDSGGVITGAAISVGACSEVAQRIGKLEKALVGKQISEAVSEPFAPDCLANLSPIDDVRATAAYRMQAAEQLIRRAVARTARGDRP